MKVTLPHTCSHEWEGCFFHSGPWKASVFDKCVCVTHSQVTQEICDPSRVFRLLGSDRLVLLFFNPQTYFWLKRAARILNDLRPPGRRGYSCHTSGVVTWKPGSAPLSPPSLPLHLSALCDFSPSVLCCHPSFRHTHQCNTEASKIKKKISKWSCHLCRSRDSLSPSFCSSTIPTMIYSPRPAHCQPGACVFLHTAVISSDGPTATAHCPNDTMDTMLFPRKGPIVMSQRARGDMTTSACQWLKPPCICLPPNSVSLSRRSIKLLNG